MVNTIFDDNGYEYFDTDNHVLFSTDNRHDYLFEYITKDISCLSKLLDQYILQKIDTRTFKLKENRNENETIAQIIEIFKLIHPYYAHEYKKVIIKGIGIYFNNLLGYSVLNGNSNVLECAYNKEWYIENFIGLTRIILAPFGEYPNHLTPHDFFDKFIEWIKGRNYSPENRRNVYFRQSRKKATGFLSEIETQKKIYNMLYFLLDITAQEFQNLSTSQRMWLYSKIFNYSDLEVNHQFTFERPIQSSNYNDTVKNANYKYRYYDDSEPLYALRKLNVGRDGVPEHLINSLQYAVDCAKKITSGNIYEKYEINSLQQLLFLEIMFMIQNGTMIRKCKHCGKYFVVKNRKTAYCDRINESGIRCSAVGSKKTFQRKIESEEELKIYNRAYKTHYARFRNGKMKRCEFELWTKEAKEQLENVRSGELDISIFREWLKK